MVSEGFTRERDKARYRKRKPIPAIVIVTGFACAVLLALGGGAIPAWRGLRLRVVDALANR